MKTIFLVIILASANISFSQIPTQIRLKIDHTKNLIGQGEASLKGEQWIDARRKFELALRKASEIPSGFRENLIPTIESALSRLENLQEKEANDLKNNVKNLNDELKNDQIEFQKKKKELNGIIVKCHNSKEACQTEKRLIEIAYLETKSSEQILLSQIQTFEESKGGEEAYFNWLSESGEIFYMELTFKVLIEKSTSIADKEDEIAKLSSASAEELIALFRLLLEEVDQQTTNRREVDSRIRDHFFVDYNKFKNADILLSSGDSTKIKEAVEILNNLNTQVPNNKNVYVGMAACHHLLRNTEKEQEYYKRIGTNNLDSELKNILERLELLESEGIARVIKEKLVTP